MRIHHILICLLTAPVCLAQQNSTVIRPAQLSPSIKIQFSQQAGAVNPGVTLNEALSAMTESSGSQPNGEQSEEKMDPQQKKQRDALFKRITFDRRPSTILKAWSTPFDPDEEENQKTDEQKKKEAEAKAKAEEARKTAEAAAKKQEKEAEKARLEAEKEMTDEQKKNAAEARKTAEEAKKKAAEEAAQKKQAAEKFAAELKQLKIDLRLFQRNVTLGNWDAAQEFLSSLKEEEAKKVYPQLLQSLIAGPPGMPKTRYGLVIGQFNVIRANDVLALAELCPEEKLNDSMIGQLGQLANLCQKEGEAEYVFLDELKSHVAKATNDEPLKMTRRMAARILFAANRIEQAKSFLPDTEVAIKENDAEALSILTDVFLRLSAKERDPGLLEKSWTAAQALLVCDKADQKQTLKAMKRCVSLVPKLQEGLGQQWLAKSFTANPEKGIEILAGIGGETALSMSQQPQNVAERLGILELQTTAVDALLKKAPENAKKWSDTLHLLAANWLREATYSRQYDQTAQRGQRMTRDSYGNYYWSGGASSSRPPTGMPQPLQSGKVLDVRPGESWLKHLRTGYRSRFSIETARLHLRVKEEMEAFPFIEQLAETHPEEATDLVREFFDVWAENHDPNSQARQTSMYMFSYGFSQRSNGIPLTRSRQVRNLSELSDIVKRVRQLPLGDIDDKWISAAFTRVHSSAEVYQLSDMEQVFGEVDSMTPETLAALVQTMRMNLATIWRKPDVQQQAKTKRKQREIQQEVVDGYEEARRLLTNASSKHPDSWPLTLAAASIMHDENDYRSELKHSAGFAGSRNSALNLFSKAVDQYASTVGDLRETEYDVDPFLMWFNASLGAPDLAQITQEKLPVLKQMPLIKAAFERLPETSRDAHAKMFANTIFTRMSSVNPAVKFRYVKNGLDIAGMDFDQSREARKVFEYYNDLVNEIRLETVVDGSPAVGHEQPFGVYVNLKHTKAIERESGGFSKYLQNQNAGSGYYYNYGRPTENYREKFEQYARESLDEHFEVLSVTFQPENVKSRATDKPDWRTTSYAYILLKARGPEVDRVAPVKLDLDFLDTTGYVVLPVESQGLLVDCTTTTPEARPVEDLSLTQTLDERQAKEGKLILEVKATAQGLIPELSDLIDLKFADFEVVETEDNGVSVSRFDPDANRPIIVSERVWAITLKDGQKQATGDREFQFANCKFPLKEEVWQRYDDADLVAVGQSVVLQEKYDQPESQTTLIATSLVAFLLVIGAVLLAVFRKGKGQIQQVSPKFAMPDNPTPFNVLSLLKDIERSNGFAADAKQELKTSIQRLERQYFADDEQPQETVDLQEVAKTWVRKAR